MTVVRCRRHSVLFVTATHSRKLDDIAGSARGCITLGAEDWWVCVAGDYTVRELSSSEAERFAVDWPSQGERLVGLKLSVRGVEGWGSIGQS